MIDTLSPCPKCGDPLAQNFDGRLRCLRVACGHVIDMRDVIFISGAQCLGDNIYQRRVVRAALDRWKNVYLETPWPQLFWDLAVKLVKPPYANQVAAENMDAAQTRWVCAPPISPVKLEYTLSALARGLTPVDVFADQLGVSAYRSDLAVHPSWITAALRVLETNKLRFPIALVHPPTTRPEYQCPARNPRVEHLQRIIDRLESLTWISLARIDEEERLDGPELTGCVPLRLPIETVLGLIKLAKLTLFGPSWFLPACLALGANSICVFGGYVPPGSLIDDAPSGLRVLAPEPFCACFDPTHNCVKEISERRLIETADQTILSSTDSEPIINRARDRLALNVPQGIGDIFWIIKKFAPHVDKLDLRICCTDVQREIERRAVTWLRLFPQVGKVELHPIAAERYQNLIAKQYDMRRILQNGREPTDYACNRALEEGVRLEEIDSGFSVRDTVELMRLPETKPFAGRYWVLYVSGSVPAVWSEETWVELMEKLRERNGSWPVLLVGASYDRQIITKVEAGLYAHGFLAKSWIDRAPGEVLSAIQRSLLFVGYQSGLSILADNLDVKQLMLYLPKLEKLMFSWPKKKNIESGAYNAGRFDEPVEILVERVRL